MTQKLIISASMDSSSTTDSWRNLCCVLATDGGAKLTSLASVGSVGCFQAIAVTLLQQLSVLLRESGKPTGETVSQKSVFG